MAKEMALNKSLTEENSILKESQRNLMSRSDEYEKESLRLNEKFTEIKHEIKSVKDSAKK